MKYFTIIFLSCLYFSNLIGQEIIVCCDDNSIRRFNLADSSSTILCYTGLFKFDDIAINPLDNKLYGTTGSSIHEIDILTGNVTHVIINSWPTSNFNALTFDSYGNLYAKTGISDVLYKIDIANQSIVALGSCGTGYASCGDLTFYQGELYLVGLGGSNNTKLIKIDYNNPANSIILGNFPYFYALATTGCQEEFYGIGGNSIIRYNPTSPPQYLYYLQVDNFVSVYGATSYPPFPNKVKLGNDTTLCDGQLLQLEPKLPYLAEFLWSNNSTDSQIIVNQFGEYWVEISVCDSTISDTINVAYNPLPSFSIRNDTTICNEETLILDATTSNASYLWQNNSSNPTLYIEQQGNYWVQVTVDNCTSADTIKVLVENCDEIELDIPNVFTPNNDEYNEIFTPSIQKGIISINTSIYNRWGELIFNSNFLNIGWDGRTNSGMEVPAGTYYWIINYSDINGDENKIKGYLTLLR